MLLYHAPVGFPVGEVEIPDIFVTDIIFAIHFSLPVASVKEERLVRVIFLNRHAASPQVGVLDALHDTCKIRTPQGKFFCLLRYDVLTLNNSVTSFCPFSAVFPPALPQGIAR